MRNGYGDAIRRTGLVLQSWFCRAPNTLVTPRRWGVKAEPLSTTPGLTLKKRVWEGALAARKRSGEPARPRLRSPVRVRLS